MKINEFDKEVTQKELDILEMYIDKVFNKVGIDVEFTRHFLDRVNDERNRKQITTRELGNLFAKEYKRWGKPIAQLGPDQEAVMKDLESDINIPFALKWDRNKNQLELIAKTVMRKKNFRTPNKEFPVESIEEHDDPSSYVKTIRKAGYSIYVSKIAGGEGGLRFEVETPSGKEFEVIERETGHYELFKNGPTMSGRGEVFGSLMDAIRAAETNNESIEEPNTLTEETIGNFADNIVKSLNKSMGLSYEHPRWGTTTADTFTTQAESGKGSRNQKSRGVKIIWSGNDAAHQTGKDRGEIRKNARKLVDAFLAKGTPINVKSRVFGDPSAAYKFGNIIVLDEDEYLLVFTSSKLKNTQNYQTEQVDENSLSPISNSTSVISLANRLAKYAGKTINMSVDTNTGIGEDEHHALYALKRRGLIDFENTGTKGNTLHFKVKVSKNLNEEVQIDEDLGSIPPLTDLIVMAVVGQTTVAALKAAYKTGKYALKLKRLADKAGVKLNNAVIGESTHLTPAERKKVLNKAGFYYSGDTNKDGWIEYSNDNGDAYWFGRGEGWKNTKGETGSNYDDSILKSLANAGMGESFSSEMNKAAKKAHADAAEKRKKMGPVTSDTLADINAKLGNTKPTKKKTNEASKKAHDIPKAIEKSDESVMEADERDISAKEVGMINKIYLGKGLSYPGKSMAGEMPPSNDFKVGDTVILPNGKKAVVTKSARPTDPWKIISVKDEHGKTFEILQSHIKVDEAINRDEYAAKLAMQQKDKFFKAALAALDRLVKSDPRGQDVGGYAFDIARAFNGVNGRELARAYDEIQ